MSRPESCLSKDEIIRLHQLLWKAKDGLVESGLKPDLKEYIDFGVYVWRPKIGSSYHWHAINILAEELSREAVRILRLKM